MPYVNSLYTHKAPLLLCAPPRHTFKFYNKRVCADLSGKLNCHMARSQNLVVEFHEPTWMTMSYVI